MNLTQRKGVTVKIKKIILTACAVTGLVALSACSSNESDSAQQTTSTTSASSSSSDLPTVEELNELIQLASDPDVATDVKVQTVEDGETAPELFETMTRSKQESGAEFTVVAPVLPGYTSNSALATVQFTLPDRAPQTADNVEFINENGQWKLSKSWACTLITNTVSEDQIPATCNDITETSTSSGTGQ